MEMEYTNLKTYTIQMKCIKMIYEIKITETDYLNKTNELEKLLKNYEGIFDNEDVCNVKGDIPILEGKVQEDKQYVKIYSELIEHIEILCNSGGNKETKYLDTTSKHAVNWIHIGIQKMEED